MSHTVEYKSVDDLNNRVRKVLNLFKEKGLSAPRTLIQHGLALSLKQPNWQTLCAMVGGKKPKENQKGEERVPSINVVSLSELMKMEFDKPEIWKFKPGVQTYIQTDSVDKDESFWYLSDNPNDDPAYHIELEPNAKSILSVMDHVGRKTWVDDTQLYEALLPAIRAVNKM